MSYAIKFWDELNGCEEYAFEHRWKDGEPSEFDIETVLEAHAENDTDGWTDGLYHDSPQPYMVLHPDGSRERWEVGAELEPRFIACRVREEDR